MWTAWTVLVALCAGCGTDAAAEDDRQVVVFAAASLTEALTEVAEAFESENAGVEVVLNFAGSQSLATQLIQGARADVMASADPRQIAVLDGEGLLAGRSTPLLSNELAIAVEPGNPLGIADLADLSGDEVILVQAAPQVPAGRYAAEALAGAGVETDPASLENDVRAALSRVSLGEADAAVVYTSDIVAAAGAVDGVPIPAEHNVVAHYEIATLADALNAPLAEAFVQFALTEPAQAILAQHGFGPP